MGNAFVIHIHRGFGPTHYDLMLEHDGALATWQLQVPPDAVPAGPLAARRLADHRREYLTYQGPVSKGRGDVETFDAGEFRLIEQTQDCWRFELRGRRMSGLYELRREVPAAPGDAAEPDQWRFILPAAPPADAPPASREG